ncbi:MAG: hypothetical protein MJ123_01310 [Lachnospiraceae bacterium]|nr:hypothetical protein [Lachnospiraceae bacterium]
MNKRFSITAKDIVTLGAMVAIIEASKAALSFLPNIELTSFWLIVFTLVFGWKIALVVPAFILVEGLIYGMGLWWIMYLYVWPLLVLVAWLLRKMESSVLWAAVSGFFGLLFGFLCSFVYLVTGNFETQIAWWIAGIPWDIVHCIGNFVLMLVLYKPVMAAMKKLCVGKYSIGS